MFNPYILQDIKNLIPFNLKKKKIKIQGNLVAVRKLQFFYSYLEINGLKRDNSVLDKKFRNKKLGVFFVSNINMIDSKWAFIKAYHTLYNQKLKKKIKKVNTIKNNIIKNYFYSNFYYFNINYYKIISITIQNYFYLTWKVNFFIKNLLSFYNEYKKIINFSSYFKIKKFSISSIFWIRSKRTKFNTKNFSYNEEGLRIKLKNKKQTSWKFLNVLWKKKIKYNLKFREKKKKFKSLLRIFLRNLQILKIFKAVKDCFEHKTLRLFFKTFLKYKLVKKKKVLKKTAKPFWLKKKNFLKKQKLLQKQIKDNMLIKANIKKRLKTKKKKNKLLKAITIIKNIKRLKLKRIKSIKSIKFVKNKKQQVKKKYKQKLNFICKIKNINYISNYKFLFKLKTNYNLSQKIKQARLKYKSYLKKGCKKKVRGWFKRIFYKKVSQKKVLNKKEKPLKDFKYLKGLKEIPLKDLKEIYLKSFKGISLKDFKYLKGISLAEFKDLKRMSLEDIKDLKEMSLEDIKDLKEISLEAFISLKEISLEAFISLKEMSLKDFKKFKESIKKIIMSLGDIKKFELKVFYKKKKEKAKKKKKNFYKKYKKNKYYNKYIARLRKKIKRRQNLLKKTKRLNIFYKKKEKFVNMLQSKQKVFNENSIICKLKKKLLIKIFFSWVVLYKLLYSFKEFDYMPFFTIITKFLGFILYNQSKVDVVSTDTYISIYYKVSDKVSDKVDVVSNYLYISKYYLASKSKGLTAIYKDYTNIVKKLKLWKRLLWQKYIISQISDNSLSTLLNNYFIILWNELIKESFLNIDKGLRVCLDTKTIVKDQVNYLNLSQYYKYISYSRLLKIKKLKKNIKYNYKWIWKGKQQLLPGDLLQNTAKNYRKVGYLYNKVKILKKKKKKKKKKDFIQKINYYKHVDLSLNKRVYKLLNLYCFLNVSTLNEVCQITRSI